MNVANNTETVPTQNVVAVWEGSDPVLKAEYVALGAHYDHVGSRLRRLTGTTRSATARTTMAPARLRCWQWRKRWRKHRRVRSVRCCSSGIAAKRKDCGARVTSLNIRPCRSIKIVAQLNIDMIGRSKKEGDTNPRNKELTGPDADLS